MRLHPRVALHSPDSNNTCPEKEQEIMGAPHSPKPPATGNFPVPGSAASNFQSFPYPLHTSPRKVRKSNNRSADWVVTLGNYPIKGRHRPRAAPLLAGTCSSHSPISVSPSQFPIILIIKILWRNISKENTMPGSNFILIFYSLFCHFI